MSTSVATAPESAATPRPGSRLRRWLTESNAGVEEQQHRHLRPWWMVMCLTGVDYFSTLGYQPGIAALAAGSAGPIATVVLVLLTLLGALPVYRRVAAESPYGQGSIAMLERLLPFWRGKFLVLVLLGFAFTDFVITITLSAADAAAHIVENPLVSAHLHGQNMVVTLLLLALLGAVFLRGFGEAIGIAVVLVGVYLALNLVVVLVALGHVAGHPHVIHDWQQLLTHEHGDPVMVVAFAALVFPKLALGMSGFETGVAVMPLIRGGRGDAAGDLAGRIRNTKKLLVTAAVIMSGYLIASSLVTTWLIPERAFQSGGKADGRALAFLAHTYLGNGFGTLYDVSTVAILWFAGASAMAGMLNLIPRYLPRYGMAPEWTRAQRALVVVITVVSVAITVIFDANVNAQGGAYATGVLVLITSAAVAVALAARKAGQRAAFGGFVVVALILVYTTADNIVERPDGVKIGAIFIAAIVGLSVLSRLLRAFELRVTEIRLDDRAQMFVRDAARRTARLVANRPDARDRREYHDKIQQIVDDNELPDAGDIVFVEVTVSDPSDFESVLDVHGEVLHGSYRVLTMSSPSVANAIAALTLRIRDDTGTRPHVYFEWTEGNPARNFLKFLLLGGGEVAPVTREILRRAEPRRARRPHVHVG